MAAVRNLTHRTTHELGVAIVTGVYAAEQPMPSEEELSRRHHLSRSVVREAIKMLSAKGLLYSRPRTGILVQPEHRWNLLDADVLAWHLERPFSLSLMREFTDLRLSLEPAAAALAATRASVADTSKVVAALEKLSGALRAHAHPLELAIEFHTSVLRASGNGFFAQFSALAAASLKFARRAPGYPIADFKRSLTNYRRIVNAIGAGNAGVAESAMRALIQEQMP